MKHDTASPVSAVVPPLVRPVWQDVGAAFALFGRYLAIEKLAGGLLAAIIVACQVVQSVALPAATVAMGAIIAAAAARNAADAGQSLYLFTGATLLAGVCGIVDAAAINGLAIRWRRVMTRRLVRGLLRDRHYYHLHADRLVDNPEQRIESDLDRITTFLTLVNALIGQLVSSAVYAWVLLRVPVDGLRLFGLNVTIPGVYLYLAVGAGIACTVGSHYAGRALVRLASTRERVEADFRAAMYAIRRNSLSVAFQRDELREEARLHDRIVAIRRNWVSYTLVVMRYLSVSMLLSALSFLTPVLSFGSLMAGRGNVGQLSVTKDGFDRVSGIFAFIGTQYEVFAQLRASVWRVQQLEAVLEAPVRSDIAVSYAPGAAIRVEGLTIALPDGRALLHVDDFAVQPGERVLLRGPSGTGKSSFLRVLGGLWRHGGGSVILPEGARMTFVPQQSHLPEGTLADLLAGGDGAGQAAVLQRLGLGALAARLHDVADWSRILSPGEQQRIVAARAILARPDFLFVDEGTSALDPALEQVVYAELVRALPHAAILSIAHRPAVAHFHHRIVEVAEGVLQTVETQADDDRVPAPCVLAVGSTGGEVAVPGAPAAGVEETKGLVTLGDDIRYLGRLIGRYVRLDPWVALAGGAAIVALPFASSYVGVQQFAQFGAITDAVVARSTAQVWQHLQMALILVLLAPALSAVMLGINNLFMFRIRRVLTTRMVARWLSDRRYHWAEQRGGLDNPEQRIQEDIANIPDMTVGLIRMLSSSVSTISLYGGLLWTLSAARGDFLPGLHVPGMLFWAAAALGVLMTVTIQLVAGRLTPIEFERQHLNAMFRMDMLALRRNAEAVAFERGEAAWHDRLVDGFARIFRNWLNFIAVYTGYTAAIQLWTVIVTVVPIVVVLAPIVGGAMSVGQIGVVSQAFMQIALSIGVLATNYHMLARFRASVSRVRQLEAVLEAPVRSDIAVSYAPGAAIRVEGLTIALPDGRALLHVDDFAVQPGERVLLRGPSGTGKSSFLRVLGGLWRHGGGSVILPEGARMTFVPQQSHLPEGTLADLLAGGDDAGQTAVLQRLGLGALAARLHDVADWSRILSPGEQQRIVAARAILARPDFLFIDEGTSALDPALEQMVYAELVRALPHAAILSIAHRPAVAHFHHRIVEVAGGAESGRLVEVR